MTALCLALFLSHAGAQQEPAPAAPPPAAAEAPPAATPPAPVPEPLWKTLPSHPWFVRGFSAAVLGVGATGLALGAGAFGVMLGLRFSPALDRIPVVYRDNAVGISTLLALTGLMVGGVLTLGGVLGMILL